MIETIIQAIVLAYEMLDGLIDAANQAGISGEDLDERIRKARAARKAQLAADREEEREILP